MEAFFNEIANAIKRGIPAKKNNVVTLTVGNWSIPGGLGALVTVDVYIQNSNGYWLKIEDYYVKEVSSVACTYGTTTSFGGISVTSFPGTIPDVFGSGATSGTFITIWY